MWSYLSKACHLLSVPASFGQGVDGHLAGCLGSLDGTVKSNTEVVSGARKGERAHRCLSTPHPSTPNRRSGVGRAPVSITRDYSMPR